MALVRTFLFAAMVLPLGAVAACSGSSFTASGDDGGPVGSSDDATADAGDDGTIVIYHDGGPDAHDASASDAHGGVGSDATVDAPEDVTSDGPSQDGDGWAGCPTGDLTCNGQCVANDTKNCGSCGHDCTNLPHVSGAVSCDTSSGACAFSASSCAPGWAHCSTNPDDGCETSISSSPNCGGCGVTCGATDPVCQGSGGSYSCVTVCSGNTPTLCNGSCVDTSTDPSNCGGCSKSCMGTANGQPTCANATCGISCNTGYTDCSGACLDTTSNDNDCGQCGKACTGGEHCVSSTCQCTGGTHLCSGTCVADDVNACGPNCVMCTAPANATPNCDGTACGWTCNPGYTECNGACYQPDTNHGVFVAPQGGTSSSCGTEVFPCGTLTAALTVVSQSVGAKTIVYIDDTSTLSEPQMVSVPAGVTIEGGWVDSAGVWTYDCNPTALPSIQPVSGYAAISASYSGSSTIQNLKLLTKATANVGESLYGVYATGAGTSLALDNVQITVAQGGAGSTGSTGGAGSNGSSSGCSPASDGADGGVGVPGGAGTSGYGPSGFVDTSTSTSTGGVGLTGDDGTLQAPQCGTSYGCHYNTQDLICESGSGTMVCAQAGTPGCPGTGGLGGGVGQLGGASIGVFAYAANVTIQGVSVTTADGGAGGTGGTGGPGGNGAAGLTGANGDVASGCKGAQKPCTSSLTPLAGGVGGPGGNGGKGGQGGGGAGGDSYCVVSGGGGAVGSGWTCTNGAGGAGGMPNGTVGRSGQSLTF